MGVARAKLGWFRPPPKMALGPPLWPKWWPKATPTFYFIFFKKKKNIYIYIYIWHVQPRVANVKIRQFWTEKLTEVPCSSFPIAHVPPMKKMKN
jgi:hypothetical protein